MHPDASASGHLPPIWSEIFQENSTWLKEMKELQELKPFVLPTLVGYGLHDVKNRSKLVYLVLLAHDLSDELRYSKGALMESLKSFKYVGRAEDEDEVHILGTNITLNIAECVGGSECILMDDPSRMFDLKHGAPRTSVLCFGVDDIYDVPSDQIGGIEENFFRRKKLVQTICSIKMELGDKKPIYRIFVRKGIHPRLRNIVTRDDSGRPWVTGWKQVKSGWRT